MKLSKTLIFIIILTTSISAVFAQESCLYRNPLCFYNTDILSYLQVLHKNQQYEKMTPFFYGPYSTTSGKEIIDRLSEADFGCTLKRVGINETSTDHWSLTYERTMLGTKENFKIECTIINDTCRVFLDEKQWNKIFK